MKGLLDADDMIRSLESVSADGSRVGVELNSKENTPNGESASRTPGKLTRKPSGKMSHKGAESLPATGSAVPKTMSIEKISDIAATTPSGEEQESQLQPRKSTSSRVSGNLSDRMAILEKTVGGDPNAVEGYGNLDDLIQAVEANSATVTEINLNGHPGFIKMTPDKRLEKQMRIGWAMQSNSTVTSIELANTLWEDKSTAVLTESLMANTSVTKINLESNNITGDGIKNIANLIQSNHVINEIKINNQQYLISTDAEEALMEAVLGNEVLIKLNLDIRDKGIKERIDRKLTANMDKRRSSRYAENLEAGKVQLVLSPMQLNILSIINNEYEGDTLDFSMSMEFQQLKDAEKCAFARAFGTNQAITMLKLDKLGLTDSFAEAFGEALKTNTKLTIVQLNSNKITGVGIKAIAEGLKANITLKELKLQDQSGGPISTDAEEALMDALMYNETLLKFAMAIRNATCKEAIEKALRRNNDLVRQRRRTPSQTG